MTLDEARNCLAVTSAASTAEIREAFRARARAVHPDRHPRADSHDLERLTREFHRAMQARDLLIRHASDPLRTSSPTPSPAPPASHQEPASAQEPAAPRAARARPRTSESRQPTEVPRVTMRFDEFVEWSDATGFGVGVRSPRWIDWTRVVVWSGLSAVVVATGAALAYVATSA